MDLQMMAIETASRLSSALFSEIESHKEKLLSIVENKMSITESIKSHIHYCKSWAEEINFRDLPHSQKMANVYIQLDTYLYPKSIRISDKENIRKEKLIKIIAKEENHLMIMGQPGSGKTTSMKYFINKVIEGIDVEKAKQIPILIIVREMLLGVKSKNNDKISNIIFDHIVDTLGIKNINNAIIQILINNKGNNEIDDSEDKEKRYNLEYRRRICNYLDKVCSYLIIEGIDESISEDMKKSILFNINFMAKNLNTCKVISTIRTGEQLIVMEKVEQYEIAPLDKEQIKKFVKRWFPQKSSNEILLAQIENSPFYDATIKPLTLAHLCAIYERSGSIPEKPRTVYRKIVNLLLEEWDQQRAIIRGTKYSRFETDRKFEFISNIAYKITIKIKKNIFTTYELKEVYKEIYVNYDLPKDQVESVVEEIESHTGLIIKCSFQSYEFTHKSLQEYLTAEFISRLPDIYVIKNYINILPNEFAVAVTLSSDQSLYFSNLVLNHIIKIVDRTSFIMTFVNRLIQEKPDFNVSQEINVSFIALYSRYIEIENKLLDKQTMLIPFDANFDSFERIFNEIVEKNNFNSVLEKYKIASINESLNDKMLLLVLKEHYNNYPKYMYARESFFKKTV